MWACALWRMHVCVWYDLVEISSARWSNIPSNTRKTGLNKSRFGRYCAFFVVFFLLLVHPLPLCVCASLLQQGRLEELFIWNSRSGLHGEAPGLLLKSGVATDCVTPDFLSFSSSLHPSLLCWLHFSWQALTHVHSSLFYWLTFTDVLAVLSFTNALPLCNLQLTLNAATEAKNASSRRLGSALEETRTKLGSPPESAGMIQFCPFKRRITLKACSNLFPDMEAALNWPGWGAEGG